MSRQNLVPQTPGQVGVTSSVSQWSSAASPETVMSMRCAAGVPPMQRDPSTSGWWRRAAPVRWMTVARRSGWAAASPARPTVSTRWIGSCCHAVVGTTAAGAGLLRGEVTRSWRACGQGGFFWGRTEASSAQYWRWSPWR